MCDKLDPAPQSYTKRYTKARFKGDNVSFGPWIFRTSGCSTCDCKTLSWPKSSSISVTPSVRRSPQFLISMHQLLLFSFIRSSLLSFFPSQSINSSPTRPVPFSPFHSHLLTLTISPDRLISHGQLPKSETAYLLHSPIFSLHTSVTSTLPPLSIAAALDKSASAFLLSSFFLSFFHSFFLSFCLSLSLSLCLSASLSLCLSLSLSVCLSLSISLSMSIYLSQYRQYLSLCLCLYLCLSLCLSLSSLHFIITQSLQPLHQKQSSVHVGL